MNRLPLIILAGGFKESERVSGSPGGPRLAGPKGMTIQLGGQPLIDAVVERFSRCDAFGHIFIAGPAASYGERRGIAEVIDTDSNLADNMRTALDTVRERLSPSEVAFTTCDVLPEPEDLRVLLDDYQAHRPVDFWYPQIRVPEDPELLGASAGKRQYLITPEGETEPAKTLPGHLLVLDPDAMRFDLLHSCFELAYKTRTQPVPRRFLYMISHVLAYLLATDLRRLVRLKPPILTIEVLVSGLLLARGLNRSITQERLEVYLRRIFGNWRHRAEFKDRPGRVPVLAALSLAKDIDTPQEAEERALEFGKPG